MAFTFCRRKQCSSDGTIVMRNASWSVAMMVSNHIVGYNNLSDKQCNIIRGMLEGRDGWCMFWFDESSSCEIEMTANVLTISGSNSNLLLCQSTKLEVDYPANKAEVDKFLNFLLDAESNASDDKPDEEQ